MRKLILKMSMSVDGYVAGPNGEKDWTMRSRDPEGAAWVEQTLREAGAHLVGRRTYDEWVGFWPTATGPMAEPGKDLLAQGGVSFAQSLVRLGLVDEYRLVMHPVVLGSGLALFDGAPEFDFELIDSVRFASGAQAFVYRPAL
jgi:dihydrofolate reductase